MSPNQHRLSRHLNKVSIYLSMNSKETGFHFLFEVPKSSLLSFISSCIEGNFLLLGRQPARKIPKRNISLKNNNQRMLKRGVVKVAHGCQLSLPF